MKRLFALLLIVPLMACQTKEVPARDVGHIDDTAPSVVDSPEPVEKEPSYYRVIVDKHHNVICVDTDAELNFFSCDYDNLEP